MLDLVYTTQFKKDYKLAQKRDVDIDELFKVIGMLQKQEPLPEEKRDHFLVGNYKGYRECHVRPDLLLIYKIKEKELELLLFRTGTHSDLY
ncbi:type II toxin-antitoxin system YafQ family toxin [Treponema sp. Marseille-Q4132]|uniref:type II toxin-antitoxin system YafQ family toxin n=1 Tax=Treponema sp. Marseille-Q4132 TaxID=2766701 RepID=UPI001652D820|nr:type II toxin-antitoxin system YafQ family toxin [Treponema sp. Marseille-Q4132]QNL98311.1 type II toxin-antitoxin system YafQ family toxin [Treponema sp. Marseille-Q4132]